MHVQDVLIKIFVHLELLADPTQRSLSFVRGWKLSSTRSSSCLERVVLESLRLPLS